MNSLLRIAVGSIVLASFAFATHSAMGQEDPISASEIAALSTKLAEANKALSSARKKLAIRRVIREAEALIEDHPTAKSRYEVLNVLFRSQQALVGIDNTSTNRRAFLATCEKLAAAPDEYAAIRLDADLLLTQAESARRGADSYARADALRPLVQRYRDTNVEAKVIRVAMLMALELGNTRLVNDLRRVVAERFPGDMDLINFQREKLATQVFGAPFIGNFETSEGKTAHFPMDFLGTTTAIYFWSQEDEVEEDLTELATAWKAVEANAAGRFQFVSMNMDDLPDAGESVIRKFGLSWPALKMAKGQDNPIYKTYVKRETPTILVVSPTGYAALYLSGSRSDRSYERRLQSMMARSWANSVYTSQLQSIFTAEFLIMSPQGDFDPATPPEYKSVASGNTEPLSKLPRSAECVPEEILLAIQACFIHPPTRYKTPHAELLSNYEKADSLCRAAVAEHPNAPDLWMVRNRRITALMGLWKLRGDRAALAEAVVEAKAVLEGSSPNGTDIVARLCLAREALRLEDADLNSVIDDLLGTNDRQQASAPALAAASLLALDSGDRLSHDRLRRIFLDKYADSPAMWTVTAFLLDRYHRYWQYHPPFTAGWTYGRRQGHFLSIGTPEDAQRSFKAELKTLDGETVNVPDSSEGKWTVVSFVPTASGNGYLERYAVPIADRPFDDIRLFAVVLDDDADSARKLIEEKKKPDTFPSLLLPDGLNNPIVRKVGILAEDTKPNILILRPDGSIALTLSGLAMSAQKGYVIQNVIDLHDEKVVDAALARGDLDEAKRLAFALAPIPEPTPEGEKKKPAPKISIPHLRSRAKVYLAMGNLEAALDDAEQSYLAVNSQAGHISMRTDELEETEALKAKIVAAIKEAAEK